ncbi:MAG: bifunctional oligoribonuclease/PAP phosphatase NrnA [Deltaproteobacteria bacterium]|nr:bifunctional oligoribonuclease/PAP phosphatase NrnA [Deltaproteobacteria bacterium]
MDRLINEIVSAIEADERILIASHLNPDGDAIGSSLALALALKKMNKDVFVYNRDGVPYQFEHLPGAEMVATSLDSEKPFDSAVVLDCSELERVGKDFSSMVATKKWINIDHHLTNEYFADITLIDKDACSTGYLVFNVLKALPVELDKAIADNIYTTIIVDTGSFRYSNATNEAFIAAGELVSLGVSPWEISNKVYENQPLGRMKLLSLVLDSLRVSENGKVASLVVTKEMMSATGTGHEETDGFVNYARSIEGVEVAFLVREITSSEYKISYRSKGLINVASVARSFGGGGHRNAAGCVMEGSLEEARKAAFYAAEKEVDAS